MRLRAHKTLVIRIRRPYIAFTQFARACGRVPVGGHPDKRPDSRQGLEDGWRGWTSLKSRFPVSARRLLPDTDRQPEAKPANPESPRGTQLKATTERAFLVSAGFQVRRTEEACPSCRACGGDYPFQTMAFPKRRCCAPRKVLPTAQRHCRNGPSPGLARRGMQQFSVSRLHRAGRRAFASLHVHRQCGKKPA